MNSIDKVDPVVEGDTDTLSDEALDRAETALYSCLEPLVGRPLFCNDKN